MAYFNYKRRQSSVARIGDTPMGGDFPIRIQSMANVSTMDTDAAVAQAIRMIEAGAEYVRFTAQGEREARNLGEIRERLNERGYTTPLVADIHFNPRAADVAAERVEKVRINPGNYVDKVKTFSHVEYTDEEYAAEIEKIRARFVPFLNICKAHGTAIRIGVNHGSLSDRIMSRYGDTPEGMVASCMEFLRICRDEDFPDVVISIKASNTVVMVRTVRLLVRTMEAEGMRYPLHLGVTEAGDGEDGRIKSAVGIGALLADGIGDTIRVSLSEDPEAELPVARKLVDYILEREGHRPIDAVMAPGFDAVALERRATRVVENIGGSNPPVVISDRRIPTAVVSASENIGLAKLVQETFMTRNFRIYTSRDVISVELGGALKNVLAIAAGILDGMQLGDNPKAALMTRGIAEMARLGVALGGKRETFAGLSGIGDLIVTCMSRHSRNRHVGEELGRGKTLEQITSEMGMVVAEGVKTAISAHMLAQRKNCETPIINAVFNVLYNNLSAKDAAYGLMTREPRDEED